MRITWKDGITTLAASASVAWERAYFNAWDWPLISSMRWAITGLALLMGVSLMFGYLLDDTKSSGWNWTTGIFGFAAALFAGFGLIFVVSDYVILLMVTVVAFWTVSVLHHLGAHASMTHGPHYGR